MLFNDLDQLKLFLTEYSKMDDKTGNKCFLYREQLTRLAHREQVALIIDLDDVKDFDDELAEIISLNARRYVNLLLSVSLFILIYQFLIYFDFYILNS